MPAPTLGLLALLLAADPAAPDARAALQPFNDLVGSWRLTCTPEGTREERQANFWTGTLAVQWKFKDSAAWLEATYDKAKPFAHLEIRPTEKPGTYRIVAQTGDKQSVAFEGELKDKRLNADRHDDKAGETQRLSVRLLHSNRFVYTYEVKPDDKSAFVKKYQVGATKEGESFASGPTGPECVVSGGLGTIPVSYMGQTYYVCCTGCRDEFKANPEKYIREYEARKKGKK